MIIIGKFPIFPVDINPKHIYPKGALIKLAEHGKETGGATSAIIALQVWLP
jgi:hypothetical protein